MPTTRPPQRPRNMKTLLFFTALGFASAQQPAFEAVSIKPAQPGARGGGYNISPGRLNAKNQSLRDLVKFAYTLQDYQLTGGDDKDRYELVATYPGETTDAQRRLMLQSALTERFALAIHRDHREISGYELIHGKKGTKLKKVEPGQNSMMLGRNAANGQRTLHAASASMQNFAALLASLLRSPVDDHTELTGVFDFELEWSPDDTQVPMNIPGKQPIEGGTGPSLFNALQDTLGLVLKSRKMPVEVVVIDHATAPAAN